MKIGEFAEQNNVTAKMLRHYDEIGLLKPSGIDPETGYRSYAPEQSHPLNWILILKNLDFTLAEIKGLLSTSVPGHAFQQQLIRKRIEIASSLNEQIQKKIAIDRLIAIIEKEGFAMEKKIDLLNLQQTDVHEIKKNIPNMEMFLDTSAAIASSCAGEDHLAVLRLDLSHFKQINDNYGFDVGDNVIVACYRLIESGVETHLHHAAIGRAHGDEFVVLAKADRQTVRQTAESIVTAMSEFDFARIGCPKQMACYIGIVAAPHHTIADLRRFIEDSIEALDRARQLGPNSIWMNGDRV